jgi:hypothetical protein
MRRSSGAPSIVPDGNDQTVYLVADSGTPIPRGKYTGREADHPPATYGEHFIKCPACGGWFDCRDLGAVCSNMQADCRIRPPTRLNDATV